jgi:hypothetical protein
MRISVTCEDLRHILAHLAGPMLAVAGLSRVYKRLKALLGCDDLLVPSTDVLIAV